MKSIYKSKEGKRKILHLYDKQLKQLGQPYHDIYVKTSFGRTHLIETGNMKGTPLLVFHGGNATTAYNLLACSFLLPDFHIYAVDTIGHPGKSSERSLSPRNYDYGKWASEVITAIGYDKIACFAGSFGAGILAKAMCVSPEKIERAVLYVPSGIKNGPAYKMLSMFLPMVMYLFTGKNRWFVKTILPMARKKENIDKNIAITAKYSFDYAKIKKGMPSNVNPNYMRKCEAPALVMAAEQDCMFPARLVIPQAEKMIKNCKTYLIRRRGHIHKLTGKEKKMIVDFLLE